MGSGMGSGIGSGMGSVGEEEEGGTGHEHEPRLDGQCGARVRADGAVDKLAGRRTREQLEAQVGSSRAE